MIKVGNLTIDI